MTPRTILITGCSSGIGRALAEEFQARGHRVIATARRLETLAPLQARGIRALALDVDAPASIAALAEQLAREGLQLDVLVNNAGYGLMGPLLELSLDDARRQFETNVIAVLALVQALFPRLRQPGARVVNLGSVSGVLTTPFAGAYCATKAAVHALSDALRMELAPFGIEVITVQPGAIASSFGARAGRSAAVQGAATSRYAAIADAVAARAGASQDHATPTAEFARAFADAVLAAQPRALVRIGNGSTALPFIARWLPLRWRDRLLSRRFKLDRLRPGIMTR